MDVWNAWRHRKVGGFTSVAVLSVGISDAVTVLRASMHQSMRRQRSIRSLLASNRARIGSTITRSRAWSRERSCFRRVRIQQISPLPDPQEESQPTGNRSYISYPSTVGNGAGTCVIPTATSSRPRLLANLDEVL